MFTRLLLISHAATAAMRRGQFPADDPLDLQDAHGTANEAAAGAVRARYPVIGEAFAFCSPAACSLASALALGLEAQVAPELADMHYGRWCGKRLSDIAAEEGDALTAWSSDPHMAPHGGESFDAVRMRVGAWMDGLDDGRTVVAVTHAPVIRAAILHALNADSASFSHLEIAPLSLVELRRSERGWTWWPAPPAL
jgi:broad specificity phosphatase PhoE